VRRAKGGMASVHPLGAKELRALRRLQRETAQGVHVFVSERLAPPSVAGYQRRDPALSRSPVDCLDGEVHRLGAGSLQGLLEGLERGRPPHRPP
jgi:hypothetical protein